MGDLRGRCRQEERSRPVHVGRVELQVRRRKGRQAEQQERCRGSSFEPPRQREGRREYPESHREMESADDSFAVEEESQ